MKKTYTIVIAEDSATQAAKLQFLLEDNGYNTFRGENGKKALDIIRDKKPDLIISDILMPVMNGYELCQQVKSDESIMNIPVILLTSLTKSEDVLEGLSSGADNFLTKPYKEDYLLSHIDRILANRRLLSVDRVRVGVEIAIGNKKRFITADQQQMLSLLISSYDAAIQRNNELIEAQEELKMLNDNLEEIVNERTADLKKSEEFANRIIASSSDCINVLDLDGNLIFMSLGGQELLEIDNIEPYLNNSWFDFWEGDDRIAAQNAISMAKKGNIGKFTGFSPTAKAKPKWWEIIVSPIKDEKGNVNRLLAISRDNTDRKKSEEELIIAKEKAEESDRLKTAFLANMSHEIRTPMNGIMGFSKLLKQAELSSDQQKRFIDIIEKSGLRLLKTINAIIDISKIEAGQIHIFNSSFDVNELCEELRASMEPEVNKKNLKLSFKNNLGKYETIINTDRTKINAILSNLLNNAIKYTHEGNVEFGASTCSATGESVGEKVEPSDSSATGDPLTQIKFYVKDTGIGIPKDRQKAVFERFIQADIEDREVYEGSGLGLSIAKAYIEMLGGEIWVESEEGKGSCFYFTIPGNKEKVKTGISKTKIPKPLSEDKLKNLNILIAEDEEISVQYLTELLEDYCTKLMVAKTGEEAVNICRENKAINLILMDVKMPGINGYEATRKIREFNKEIVIIAQTAFALLGDKEKAIEAGCNDYITKPINRIELLEKIKQHWS